MAETTVSITAGTGTSIDAFNSGAGSALRQVVVLADSVTTANIAKVNADGGLLVAGTQPSGTSVSWTSATTVNTALTQTVTGYNTVSYAVTTTSTLTVGAITFEVYEPLTNAWYPLQACRINSFNTESVFTLAPTINQAWSTSVDGFTQTRIRLSTAITGTATVTVSISPQTFAIEPIVSVGQATASNLNGTMSLAAGQTLATVTTVGAVTGITNALPTGSNTIGAVNLAGRTTGGATTFTLISAATTNATLVKSSAGTVYSLSAFNNGAAAAYLKMFNLTTAPTVGTSVAIHTYMLPAGGGVTVNVPPQGFAHGTGISYSITGLPATADTTAVAANQVIVNGSYT